jgi:hypothetical protein
MYAIGSKTMKWRLVVILIMTIIMICATSIALLATQYHQTAQAYPCIGGSVKEYCTGYHDGAILAYRDFNTGHDLDISQHHVHVIVPTIAMDIT